MAKKKKNDIGDITGKGGLELNRRDKVLKVLDQTGKRFSLLRDEGRPAKLPGKRVSKKGTIYWETRKNRSDVKLSRI